MQPNAPYRPSSVSTGYDTEYLWDPAVSDTLGFIFYDYTSIPPDGPRPVYSIPPGDSTGNAGDPGNIGTQGSRDFKLYSPNLYAFSFVPSHTTPNKFGQRKIWRSIVSTSSNAPAEERMPSWNTDMANYTMVGFITGNEQPKVSWRDANRVYQPGDKAGSLWERSARYVYAIGPYEPSRRDRRSSGWRSSWWGPCRATPPCAADLIYGSGGNGSVSLLRLRTYHPWRLTLRCGK